MIKKFFIFSGAILILGILTAFLSYKALKASLPTLITVKDYQPLLVSQVYDRNKKVIGEFYRERRVLVPYEKIPKQLVQAFLAAEDDQFFEHKGINYVAIMRATLANMRAGRKVQGGSTITQQVAKTLMLSSEKTFIRKAKEAILAQQMEETLSKEDILYLYLNQIFFGQNSYGVEMASQNYFRKPVEKLELAEMAILAGLPQAPSRYSPVRNPKFAKDRQVYVLRRMAEVGFISKEESEKAIEQPVKVYLSENYQELIPSYLETVRQLLVQKLGEEMVLDKGIRIYTSVDSEKQVSAQESVKVGLKELDKRQGFRGAESNLTDDTAIQELLEKEKKKIITGLTKERIIQRDGTFAEILPKNSNAKIPQHYSIGKEYLAVVSEVDDKTGLVAVRMADIKAIIDFETMMWARKPNTSIRYDLDQIKKPSDALKKGDVIQVKISKEQYAPTGRLSRYFTANKLQAPKYEGFMEVELEQEPVVEGALVSIDQVNGDILALVGGYDFVKSKFNRTIQAKRQTGSSFKSIVYASALDKGYTPATPIMDAPIVFDETKEDAEGQEQETTWKPTNHSKKFGGDILFRNALVQSLNVPTVKIIEDLKVPWAAEYSKRLGIFSPLNPDFTLALGSSGVTLYEMTKAFSHLGRLGKRVRPLIIQKVVDRDGQVLLENLSLDMRFEEEIAASDNYFEEKWKLFLENPESEEAKKLPPIYFENPDQLISPQTAYVMTTLLKAAVEDKMGTGGRARAIGREVAGKTGTTNGYFDAWFIGYTPQISTGVWVGFDQEKSIGQGEVGGRASLPIWVNYMKAAHENLPQMTFPVPEGIVFANIDNDTGKLASSSSREVVRQAFKEGTEPTSQSNKEEDNADFYKQDLSE